MIAHVHYLKQKWNITNSTRINRSTSMSSFFDNPMRPLVSSFIFILYSVNQDQHRDDFVKCISHRFKETVEVSLWRITKLRNKITAQLKEPVEFVAWCQVSCFSLSLGRKEESTIVVYEKRYGKFRSIHLSSVCTWWDWEEQYLDRSSACLTYQQFKILTNTLLVINTLIFSKITEDMKRICF